MTGRAPKKRKGAPRGSFHCRPGAKSKTSKRHRPNYLFNLSDIHHDDSVPGTAIQKTPVRTLAHTLLAPDAENGVHVDAAERRIILIRHPEHAVFHRAVLQAGRRRRPAWSTA